MMETSQSFLEMLNAYPIAGVMLIAMLLLVQQIVRVWRGKDNVSRVELENNKLAKRTDATVSACAARTQETMDKIDSFLAANHFGQISTKLDRTLQMLGEVVHHQDFHKNTLDRVAQLCHDIDRELRDSGFQVNHVNMMAKLSALEKLIEELRRDL